MVYHFLVDCVTLFSNILEIPVKTEGFISTRHNYFLALYRIHFILRILKKTERQPWNSCLERRDNIICFSILHKQKFKGILTRE